MPIINKITKEQIEANMYSDMVSNSADKRNVTKDVYLNRHISSGQNFQTILKMYAEEMQSACKKEKQNFSSPQQSEQYRNSIDNLSDNIYLNNSVHISDILHSNDEIKMKRKGKENNCDKQNEEIYVSSSFLDYDLLSKNSLKSFEPSSYVNYNNENISAQTPESNLNYENVLGTDKTNNITYITYPSKENDNSNFYVSQDISKIHEKTENVEYDLEEKREDLEDTSSNKSFHSSTKNFPSNEQTDINSLHSLKIRGFNNIFCSNNYVPIDFLRNCYNTCNVSSSDTINKQSPQDVQLDYSSTTSIDTNRKDMTYDSNTLNMNIMHALPTNVSKENERILTSNHNKEEIKLNSFNLSKENFIPISSENFIKIKSNTIIKEKQSAQNQNMEDKLTLSLNHLFYKEFCERNQEKQIEKSSVKYNVNTEQIKNNLNEENYKIQSKNITNSTENVKKTEKKKINNSDRTTKTYKLQDMKNGKVPIPQTIFKPLPINSPEDNLINAYEKNKKLQKFMKDCNDSVNLILKYPEIKNKKSNTLYMPVSYTSLNNNIGVPIIYEDDFDRTNYHPNVTNLHMGRIFEKHVFNILKNKKDLGKQIFTKSNKFSKYSYQNGNGFWMSNIDKNRLQNNNPEQNNSYITELVYEKEKTFEEEMELLKECPNYDKIVPSLDELYKNNNFYAFLSKENLYKYNTKPDIATIMRRYDIEGISDYKNAHHTFGITPVYSKI